MVMEVVMGNDALEAKVAHQEDSSVVNSVEGHQEEVVVVFVVDHQDEVNFYIFFITN